MELHGILERYTDTNTTVVVAEGRVSSPPEFGVCFSIMTSDGLYTLPHTTDVYQPDHEDGQAGGDFKVATGIRYRLTIETPPEFLRWLGR